MASRKRSAPDVSDEEGDEDPIVNADETGSSQLSSQKRRRISDDISEPQNAFSDVDNASSQSTPLNLDTEEEEDEIAATQAIRTKRAAENDKGNTPAENGILQEVELHNFMCHTYMKYTLGPLINFICGKNGSGKSAILTAIVLCLGGKASTTNRGGRLQDFIQEGKSHASIICRIKNEGDSAYLPDEYGQVIQVERHFSRVGTSGYKLKSESGRVVSTKKVDLEEICDYLSLQIDNPMNVLSQDQARQFISTSSNAEKYKLFVKGVQLERLDQDYRLIEEQLDNIEAKIDVKKPDIKILEQSMETAKNKLHLSQRHDGILDKLRSYRRQIAWAQVEVQEKIRDEYVEAIAQADERIAEAEAQVEDLDNGFQEAQRDATNGLNIFNEAKATHQQARDEKTEAKARSDEVKQDTAAAQSDQRNIRSTLVDSDKLIRKKTEEIEQEERRIAEIDGGGATRRIHELAEARDAIRQSSQNQKDHQSSRSQLEQNVKTSEAAIKEAEDAVQRRRVDIERQKQNLSSILNQIEAQDLTFHPKMSQLLKAIQHETRFTHRPVGPIGKHVKLLKPEWSSILEKSFGASLNGFIVTGKKDQQILSELMIRSRCDVPILIGNSQSLDISPNEPSKEFDTVLRVLEIDNDLVRKAFVIQNAIEQTILIADQEEASQVLFGGHNRLRNVIRCYSIDPNDKSRGYVLFYRNGKAAQDPISSHFGKTRMRTDNEAQVRIRREAIQESEEHLKLLQQELQVAKDRYIRARKAITVHEQQERRLRIAHQGAEDEVERLEEAIKDDNVQGGRLEVLRQALRDAEQQKALHEESFMDAQNAYDEKRKGLKEANLALAVLDERIKDLENAMNKAQVAAQAADKRKAYRLGEKNDALSRIDNAKNDLASLVRKRDDMDHKIAEFADQARDVSERVNIGDGENYETLCKKYKRLKEDYDKAQQHIGGSRDEIAEQAAKTLEAYKKGLRDLRHLEALGMKLKGSLIERRERWKKFRSYISARAKAQFTYLLSERSFRGKLMTDHKQKLLELRVEPDITKRDGSGRGARTLSGGEKSFSQICLLLAIWEAMGSPIRCLDEFDVFMDAVNRSLSVNLLVEGARQSIGKQFILISPGSQSDIKRAPDVHAFQIAEPERGQTRLVVASA